MESVRRKRLVREREIGKQKGERNLQRRKSRLHVSKNKQKKDHNLSEKKIREGARWVLCPYC